MSNEKLEQLRSDLDAVNLQLLELINRRAELVQEIGKVKLKQGINRFDPERERQMLNLIVENNKGPFKDSAIQHLFKQIFKASLDLQKDETQKALLVSRKKQKDNTVVTLGPVEVGGGEPVLVSGPCSVESYEQVRQIGETLKANGLTLLRGGAFKPRTSPYDFQGLGEEGLKILRQVADEFGLKVVSEIVTPTDIEMATQYVDVIQIGARNMQNFELLKAAGRVNTPVLLKRGLSATIEEFIHAAEYIVSGGNSQVMLCERGIRTYEKATRNTLDISAVPILKQETHLPVFVDVTHSTGRRDILLPTAKAALAVGADGVMIEVHPDPDVALSDAKQQINIPQFNEFVAKLRESGLYKESAPVL
ncbi:bifunctional 3-deoxy-7-phosphoheptulonate synthase/chorismate mutase [Aneurinibacillus aneurinilyticus]|jgi:3-deoxy-7-phosphoheptulonate synthase/chorismate mutase|uniref:Bifunctional 3-deoxy-7-phosphoheptulonate synthase/chorismate mutase n=2 Tax=Aneurinibacillus aneurinilyticus TaxID=1391 RepID=A0A848D0K4_ANEAE|nr:bifunctional 3-deoxy-7-phosphoheptulonate synthase/chorismate mutase [Aneurinibacillus aneurinilyticus]ERI04087.1 3-deoxy-7-phosphoheptulonate synthase [Aneurinibacillus aneurinilyticus ATCC 12856]MCI1692483.1 bifunctional 3-deoxy-7-phosphoheptulonate synthase/chorismate mutase [Aneurinibacillus aneurinilyticus]MED0673437.1 bifunctional 3-deoxy-7-phosphoheptulonate synthase/chorismate mutase [Aneurinibacillus aneurinilyticus]MED0707831.1 bifunctional 3-deoxy-7-phosphoheptulonate synthase/cho